jgi:hypothetical protein
MNPYIQELAQQAGLISQEPNGFDPLRLTPAQQKFAELLIQRCALIADLADQNQCDCMGKNILTYFGVPELVKTF